ncbi:MAG: MerR family transcriptional regulator, partial [Gammaproteobacteria bacterium]|nr:MerR family transcriptional regulator [Gammaproteobacteria bacterium]NIT64191.1 MerR family transcriptional regulator [Gammaproteobacteria bacterium]NIV21131.1 MerR family transcriptional regulator [Gammaproteobacteria bacterium]NIY32771.1 MerR family transcriptional regulator [Gammaproteobacteria bacterium]
MAQDDGQAAAPEEAAQPQRVDTTPRYRIGAVSRLTGISTHTLRVWERRYGALSPQRTEGGDRLYSDADLVKLRLLKELQAMGHSIGTIAHLPLSGLTEIATSHRRLGATTTGGGRPAEVVNAFMEALANFALDDADRLLSQAVGQLGPRELVHSVFAPILQQVGEHWESGALGIDQEHAASTLLRNQLAVVMRTYMALGPRPQRAVLTTPSGELHEFGALLAAILFSMHGWQATYLGPNLPAAEIART